MQTGWEIRGPNPQRLGTQNYRCRGGHKRTEGDPKKTLKSVKSKPTEEKNHEGGARKKRIRRMKTCLGKFILVYRKGAKNHNAQGWGSRKEIKNPPPNLKKPPAFLPAPGKHRLKPSEKGTNR